MSSSLASRTLLRAAPAFRAPIIGRQLASAPRAVASSRQQRRAIGVQPQQPKLEGHPLPDSTPQNGPGGAERILGGIAVVVLILGGWTWFRSAQLKRERQGIMPTGNNPTKGPKEGQPTDVVG